MDTEVLNSEKLQALISYAPTDDEILSIRSYDGDKAKLGDVEKFFLEVAQVPRYAFRLQAILASTQLQLNAEVCLERITDEDALPSLSQYPSIGSFRNRSA